MIPINKRFHTDDGTDMIPQFTVVDNAYEDVRPTENNRLEVPKQLIMLCSYCNKILDQTMVNYKKKTIGTFFFK